MAEHNQFTLLRQRRFLPFFLTQALGAFNDNVYRNAMTVLIAFQIGLAADQVTLYTNLAPALFILPYLLFSAIAGQIAERYEKSRLIRFTTMMEVIIMSIAAYGFITKNPWLLMSLLFMTGLQSTLFGPVKYSIMPQMLRKQELVGGNGLVEMGTSIAILIGMIAGMSMMLVPNHGPLFAAIAVVCLAIAGNLVSRAIPPAPANAPDLKINWNPITTTWQTFKLIRKQRGVWNSILGNSWFWFVGTVLTAQLPTYAKQNLGGGETLNLLALALFSIGVGIGSLWCEKLSRRTVEIGLVPLGAIGITIFCVVLYFIRPGEAPAAVAGISEFLRSSDGWKICLALFGIGLSAGLYIVPLFAFIQTRSEPSELSRTIAGTNIVNSFAIILAAVLSILAQQKLGLTIPQLFLALGIINLIVSVYIFTIVPEFAMRFLSWIVVNTLYRLNVRNVEENIPEEGAALIVCNHVSYMDALILGGVIKRPVRFVMYYKIFNIPVMSWIFRTAKAIPIAGARENPELMQQAFDEIDKALAEGELVGIFPEGALTKDGDIAAFKTGVERILERRHVPVIPIALRGMWSSMWSKRDGRLRRMRLPRRFRAHVDVVGSPAIKDHSPTAQELEAIVRELRGTHA